MMNPIEFAVGTEDKFLHFIKSMNPQKGVALVSHSADVDGLTSAKIVNEYIKAKVQFFVGYPEINDALVQKLKESDVGYVIFTDLFIKNSHVIKEIESFAHVLIIDHHSLDIDHTSERTTFINAQGYCAAYILYYLFSKVHKNEHLDWLAACASVSDWLYTKNEAWLHEVYKKYKQEFTPSGDDIKKGRIWDLLEKITFAIIYHKKDVNYVFSQIGTEYGDIGDLARYATQVQIELTRCLKEFETHKEEIPEGYFYEVKDKFGLSSIIATTLSAKMLDKTIVIANESGEFYKFSARRQDGKYNLNTTLKHLVEGFERADGGGHFKASGASVLLKDAPELKKKLKNLVYQP